MSEVTRALPAFTNQVRDLWRGDEQLPGLLEAAEQVERLVAHPGWTAVQRVLSGQIATIDRELDEGAPKDAAGYAQQHGRRSALRAAEEAAKAILEHARSRRQVAEEKARARDAAAEAASERTGV